MVFFVVDERVQGVNLHYPVFGIGDLGFAALAFHQRNVLIVVPVPDHLGDFCPVAAAGTGGVQRSFHIGFLSPEGVGVII